MTIGKNSRKGSVRSSIRAPKFLDKSSGFYGRLDEPEVAAEEKFKGQEVEERWNGMEDSNSEGGVSGSPSPSALHLSAEEDREDTGAFDFSDGMMEDDGETLLQRKPSRLSSRWRRSSRRKQKEGKAMEEAARDERPSLDKESPAEPQNLEVTRVMIEVELEKMRKAEEEKENAGRGKESTLVHFTVREEADDQVLIRDKKRGREEEEEEVRRIKKEQEEGMKMVKRNTVKNYRKALDRAFRRGWETFIANLYSVTLTPVTSSSPPSSSPSLNQKLQHSTVLAEFR